MSTFTYSASIPNAPNDPADDVFTMQNNSTSISGIVAVDHVGFNLAGGGEHKQVTFNANNVPTLPSALAVLFSDAPSNHGGSPTYPQLFSYSGTAAQSSSQYVLAAEGSVLLMGGIILKWGSAVGVFNNDTVNFVSAFPNNCFMVNVSPITAVAVGAGSPSTTGFTFRISGTGFATIFYFAIGN